MPRIAHHDLTRFSQAILQSLGASLEEAALVAELLVDANLTGHDSHGVAQLPAYVDAYHEGLIVPGAPCTRVRETPTTALLDGHWGFGQRLAREAMAVAIEKARQAGLSAVGACHCYHVGHLGAYVRLAAAAGMIGIMAVNDGGGGQRVVPYGGLAGRLSTNPLAVGLPTGTAAPVVLDISTSVVAEGQVRLKALRGEPLPLGWLLDAQGRPTTDPAEFVRRTGHLLPLGGEVGYKGYGLAIAVEVLAGILGRAGYSRATIPPYNNGLFILVIDIARYLPLEAFAREVQALIGYVKSCPGAPGVAEILYPGEQAARLRQRRLQEGIDIDAETWRRLHALATARGIRVPSGV
jgi:uncharacterized oxidoreductase